MDTILSGDTLSITVLYKNSSIWYRYNTTLYTTYSNTRYHLGRSG